MTCRSCTSSAFTSSGSGSLGGFTMSVSPGTSLVDFPASRSFTSTSPRCIHFTALVREMPAVFATAASARVRSAISTVMRCGSVVAMWILCAVARTRLGFGVFVCGGMSVEGFAHHDQDNYDDDRHHNKRVRDIKDCEIWDSDKIDHVPDPETWLSEQTIGQIACNTSAECAEGDEPRECFGSEQDQVDHDEKTNGLYDRKNPGVFDADRKRCSWVSDEMPG